MFIRTDRVLMTECEADVVQSFQQAVSLKLTDDK